MKKVFLFLAYILPATGLFAQHVTEEQALQKAQAFMQGKVINSANGRNGAPAKPRAMKRVAQATQSDALYIFNVEDNGGYVIVSGDDRTDEILGYSTEGHIDPQQMPENMRAWIEEYEKQISSLPPSASKAPSNVPLHPAVEPLVTARWHQDAPYNLQCPMMIPDGGTEPVHCVTGCTGTAMAQIMYYHQWPKDMTTAIPDYDYGYVGWNEETQTGIYRFHEDGLPPTTFEWDLMKDSYAWDDTGVEAQAVAKLMRYCGQAVKMDYGLSGSGAVPSAQALIDYFNYDKGTKLVYRNNGGTYYSNREWDELIYGEVAAKRPVWYVGYNLSIGHTFVCDGYDGNGFFHINWGWGIGSDGYYRLSTLDYAGTGQDGYYSFQYVVVGIQPPTPSDKIKPGFEGENKVSAGIGEWMSNDNIWGVYVGYTNTTDTYLMIDGALGLLNDDGTVQVLTTLMERQLLDGYGAHIDTNWYFFEGYYEELNLEPQYPTIPQLPDGVYKMVPLWKEINETQWHHEGEYSGYYNYRELTVNGNRRTLDYKYHDHLDDIRYSATIEPVSSLVVNEQQRIAVHCVNEGIDCQEDLYLFVSQTDDMGEAISSATLYMDKGTEETVYLSFYPQQEGTYHVWVAKNRWAGANVVAQTDLQIVTPVQVSVYGTDYDWNNNTVDVMVSLPKRSEMAYDGDIAVRMWQRDQDKSEAQEYRQHVHVEPGESKDVVFQCGEWNRDKLYQCQLLYSRNPNNNVLSGYSWNYMKPVTYKRFRADGIRYSVVDENNHVVMAYRVSADAPAKLVVPATVTSPNDGLTYTVQGIDEYFCQSVDVEEVTVSEGITTIDRLAFDYCEQLRKLTLPSTLRTIGACMISNCPNLKVICSMAEEAPLTVDYGLARDYQLNTSSQADYDKIKLYVPEGGWDSYRREWPRFSHVYAKDFSEDENDENLMTGDVNGDGKVDVADIATIISIIARVGVGGQ